MVQEKPAEEVRPDSSASVGGKSEAKLTNQFNFSERASQTYNNPYRVSWSTLKKKKGAQIVPGTLSLSLSVFHIANIFCQQNRLQLPACFTKNVAGMFFHLCYLSASFFQFLIEV